MTVTFSGKDVGMTWMMQKETVKGEQCAKRHQSSCLYIGGQWILFLYIRSSSVDVPVHPRTSEVGGVPEHTRASEVGGVQEHTTEKCGCVLEYRSARNRTSSWCGCWRGCGSRNGRGRGTRGSGTWRRATRRRCTITPADCAAAAAACFLRIISPSFFSSIKTPVQQNS